jgi:hypothetical protein
MNSTYDMCNNIAYADKKCVGGCPTYFYYPLYRTYIATDELSVNYT